MQDVARQTGADLLFDHDAVSGIRARPLRGTLTPAAAIQSLLQGTNLVLRRAASGALIVERRAPAPLQRPDVTVPEILVIGRRSQNADIRRLESDIQPYRVATGVQIVESDRDSLDLYFRERVPADADAIPPSRLTGGATNSQIDLRGLGPDATLILIDGRRMPAPPMPLGGFFQPDVNALPRFALDRVETLTGTAGGIYGFGALGGVVNIVLAHPQHGLELHATGGITSQGDARQWRLEGGTGFSPDGGRTEVALYGSYARSDPLLTGQRPYISQDDALSAGLAPVLLQSLAPLGNSVFVTNLDNGRANLTLKPKYGGTSLGSPFSFLPAGSSGAPAEVAAALIQNAGHYDTSLGDGLADTEIGSNPRTYALFANVRHGFDGGQQVYFDAVRLWDRGSSVNRTAVGAAFLHPTDAADPFLQSIEIRFQFPQSSVTQRTSFDSARYTLGAVTPLAFHWQGTADVSFGGAYYAQTKTTIFPAQSFLGRDAAPFGDWDAFQAALVSPGLASIVQSQAIETRFRDFSVRLAGPIFNAPAGPATLTLLAERRIEDVPAYASLFMINQASSLTPVASRGTATTSFYAELRSRVFAEAAPSPLLRGFEVQLALRHDTETDDFARNPQSPTSDRIHARFSGTTYTAGAKVSPISWLTLRASYSTGETPPPTADLAQTVISASANVTVVAASDPKRGGNGVAGNMIVKRGGSPDLHAIQANTTAVGAIITPFGENGPRLAIDYSRIRKTDDVFTPTDQLVLDHEDSWPQRVTRGPLTDADRARGFTGGPITIFDASAGNGAGLRVDTIDARFEWRTPFFGGAMRWYGDATYYLQNVQLAPFSPDVDRVNYFENPVQERANAGADWTHGPLTIGANVQYFGRYRIFMPSVEPFKVSQAATIQGSPWVSPQTYVDLHASWRHRTNFAGAPRDIEIDLGIVNVLDQSPPRESSFSLGDLLTSGPSNGNYPGYSRFGDPRQRRFILTLSTAL